MKHFRDLENDDFHYILTEEVSDNETTDIDDGQDENIEESLKVRRYAIRNLVWYMKLGSLDKSKRNTTIAVIVFNIVFILVAGVIIAAKVNNYNKPNQIKPGSVDLEIEYPTFSWIKANQSNIPTKTQQTSGSLTWMKYSSMNCINGKIPNGEKWGIHFAEECKSLCLKNPRCDGVVFTQSHLNKGYCGLRNLHNNISNCKSSVHWTTYVIPQGLLMNKSVELTRDSVKLYIMLFDLSHPETRQFKGTLQAKTRKYKANMSQIINIDSDFVFAVKGQAEIEPQNWNSTVIYLQRKVYKGQKVDVKAIKEGDDVFISDGDCLVLQNLGKDFNKTTYIDYIALPTGVEKSPIQGNEEIVDKNRNVENVKEENDQGQKPKVKNKKENLKEKDYNGKSSEGDSAENSNEENSEQNSSDENSVEKSSEEKSEQNSSEEDSVENSSEELISENLAEEIEDVVYIFVK